MGNPTRREFLKSAGLAAGSFIVLPLVLGRRKRTRRNNDADVRHEITTCGGRRDHHRARRVETHPGADVTGGLAPAKL